MIVAAVSLWLAAAAPCDALERAMVAACARGHWPNVEQVFGPKCDRASRRFDACWQIPQRKAST